MKRVFQWERNNNIFQVVWKGKNIPNSLRGGSPFFFRCFFFSRALGTSIPLRLSLPTPSTAQVSNDPPTPTLSLFCCFYCKWVNNSCIILHPGSLLSVEHQKFFQLRGTKSSNVGGKKFLVFFLFRAGAGSQGVETSTQHKGESEERSKFLMKVRHKHTGSGYAQR